MSGFSGGKSADFQPIHDATGHFGDLFGCARTQILSFGRQHAGDGTVRETMLLVD